MCESHYADSPHGDNTMALKPDAAARKDALGAKHIGGTLQHRHFAVIAGILKDQKADRTTCADWANRLAPTNPNFDPARFIKATGHDS
jgi:hypothetical protein